MTLVIPGRAAPSNLHVPPELISAEIEGDLYSICDRLREEVPEGDRLFVVMQPTSRKPYVVMERCEDGWERFVGRWAELDGRVIKRLQYIMAVPLHKRLAEFESMEEAHERARKETELEELYENMGGAMYRQLHHDGFAHGRAENYPLAGPKVKRARSGRGK